VPADAPIVGLVMWRNVKTDPPEEEGWYPTDIGVMECYASDGKLWWQYAPSQPGPSLWCDPSPPVAGPHGTLTVEDLGLLLRLADLEVEAAVTRGDRRIYSALAARLRAALPKEGTCT
jgi:hypothetical protein